MHLKIRLIDQTVGVDVLGKTCPAIDLVERMRLMDQVTDAVNVEGCKIEHVWKLEMQAGLAIDDSLVTVGLVVTDSEAMLQMKDPLG